ncbi:MAG: nucleotidyltransferase domain-containing protein [Lachnospirales bacterium]
MFGLLDSDVEFILDVVKKMSTIDKVGVYGSRANNGYKYNSDIDIVLYGSISMYELGEIDYILNNKSPFPYFVDVVAYDIITDKQFKIEIDKTVNIISQ